MLSPVVMRTLGLRPSSAGVDAARTALDQGISRGSKALLRGALIQVSAAGAHGLQLRSDAFVLRSAAAATRVLDSWRRLHSSSRTAIGAGGAVSVTGSRRRAVASVLWRDGARLGLIVLRESDGVAATRSAAIQYAVLAESYLTTALPTTAWQKVMAQVQPDGAVSEQTALEAVALSYGRLPGVHVPSGARSATVSGDLAEDWVTPYLPRLKGRLRKAVYRSLGLTPPGVTAHTASYGDADFQPDATLTAAANKWKLVYALPTYLGHYLSLPIVAGDSFATNGTAPADATTVDQDGTNYCRVRLLPASKDYDASTISHILAHEVFHCEEFDFDPGLAHLGAWVVEGMAEWAAETLAPVPGYLGVLDDYTLTPHTPLFARSYDAEGFWGHIQDTSPDLWQKVESILAQPTPQAQYSTAGGTTFGFLTTWGASLFNNPAFAPDWSIRSPQTPPSHAPSAMITGAGLIEAAPYTVADYVINPTEPIVRVSISPASDALLGEGLNRTNLDDVLFCAGSSSAACQCPSGTTGTVPPTEPLAFPATLGVTGDPGGGTSGSVVSIPLSVYCTPIPPPVQPGSDNGDAGTGGDPHLIDFDGSLFNFQAVGEFTLLKSTTDDLQVQVRQQPFPHSRSVAVNTAVAMRVGRSLVEIDSASKLGITALVDHRAVHRSHVSLGGGGSLSLVHVASTPFPPGSTPSSICAKEIPVKAAQLLCELIVGGLFHGSTVAEVRWPDGTVVKVSNALTSTVGRLWTPALSLQIKVARRRLGHLTGLLGDAGVPSNVEFRARNGTVYDANDILNGDTESGEVGGSGGTAHTAYVLYHEFGASWRITQRESLFTYGRGKSTRFYTNLRFPYKRFDTAGASPAKKQQAAELCQAAGVKDQAVLNACEYDVLATGDPAFAGGLSPLQTVAESYGSSGGSTTPPPTTTVPTLHPIDLGTGENQPEIAYDPGSGDTYVAWIDNSGNSIDVCTVTPASPSCNGGAGPYQLTDQLAGPGTYFEMQVVVQPDGDAVVIGELLGYGVVAWVSPAGGSAFAGSDQGIADGGHALAITNSTGDTPSGGAIALDATHIGVYGDHEQFGDSFTDFTQSTPAPGTDPVPDSTGAFGNPGAITGGQLASIPDPNAPGKYIVVAVNGTANPPTGCPANGDQAVGYGVGIGTPTTLQTQAAWSTSYFEPVSCDATGPILAGGGPAGGTIGLLDTEGQGLFTTGADGIYFRQFSPASDSFGAPFLLSNEVPQTLDGADGLDLASDDTGGFYAIWADERGIELDYGTSDGTAWGAPATINLPAGAGNVIAAGVGNSNVQLAYIENPGSGDEEYLAPVNYTAYAGG